ncbi:hypothetical protein WD347_004642 [Vibrio parahaemolyticus]|uniref:hypothetical protein n=1 Tax=Vibrio parahaemolyticus TaxID=670 RepID=UPI00038E44E7|nr:hypothetical protein [Vibrio parahaemolyticus]EJG0923932.1 hypothetical protein [Vibrio parahaemolyticus O1:K68]EJG0933592.1 hypothetical protein [Vibrio parahaemolyticus O1]EJG0947758.1 hypothetical protein [Vibrio parahaemolyticus O10]EQM49649.1 hypothetical protein D051_4097 [Vibrio parahaemolyticus VPCR-2010]EGQ9064956.1 hypothetical protein [Vibrio parahaemolyticus]
MYLREKEKALNKGVILIGTIGTIGISIASGSLFLALGLSAIAAISLLLQQKFPDKNGLYSIEVLDKRITLKLGNSALWHLSVCDVESFDTAYSRNGAVIREITLKTVSDSYVLPKLDRFETSEVLDLVSLVQTLKERA